jgi:hypothetical protein
LAGIVVVAAAGAALLALTGDDDEPSDAAEEVVAPELESLEVEVADFRGTWNAVVAALGVGDQLPEPEWKADPTIGLESWSTDLGGWGTLDLYRRVGAAEIAGLDLLGAYVTPEDHARFRADAVAAVAAALALRAEVAESLLVDDLGIDDPGAPAEQTAERGRVRVTVVRDAATAQIRIAVPDAGATPSG